MTERVGTIRGLIPEDLLKFSWLEEIALAPGGLRVAYTVRRPDAERNGYQTDVYLLDLEGRGTERLSSGAGQGSGLAWARDGERLAYVWQDVGEEARVEVREADGTEAGTYEMEGSAPTGLDWSPDGRRIAFSRWTEVEGAGERGVRPGVPEPTIRVVRRLRYKQNGVGWVENTYKQIWVLELGSGDVVQVTDGECDYGEPRWSWGGERIAFTAVAREQNTVMGQGQVMVSEYGSGEIGRLMPEWRGPAMGAQWRQDDRAVVFAGYAGDPPVDHMTFYHVWMYDIEKGEARELTGDLDQTVGNRAVADQRAGSSSSMVQWPGGEGRIYFLLTEAGATHLYSVTEGGEWQKEVGGKSVTFEYSPSETGMVAYGQASPERPGDLYVLKSGEVERLTVLNRWLASRELSEPREYWYEGLDGEQVHAWEMKPVGYEEGKVYPTIVYVHCSMFSWDFNHEFQCLANAGYVVAYFNQWGTQAGYGQAYTESPEAGKGRWGAAEVMLGVDDLLDRDYVDGERLGVTGGSCGGYLTNWIVGHTDRFSAAVTQRSVVNEISKFGTSDFGPENVEGGKDTSLWKDVTVFWERSPLAYADNVRTPLLIIHSEEDHRCALEQAEQLFAALRWMGREVEMVIFQGEHHGLSRGGRPGNRIERQHRILDWFKRYLGVEPR